MTKNRQLILPAVVLGLLLIAVAIVYWVSAASGLPSFFPGHQTGSSTHHVKHGIAAFLLGLACFVFAWFQTGPTAGSRAAKSRPSAWRRAISSVATATKSAVSATTSGLKP